MLLLRGQNVGGLGQLGVEVRGRRRRRKIWLLRSGRGGRGSGISRIVVVIGRGRRISLVGLWLTSLSVVAARLMLVLLLLLLLLVGAAVISG